MFGRHLGNTNSLLEPLVYEPEKNLQGMLAHFLTEKVFIDDEDGKCVDVTENIFINCEDGKCADGSVAQRTDAQIYYCDVTVCVRMRKCIVDLTCR